MNLSIAGTTRLNDGRDMPMFGLGVWKASDEDAADAVEHALRSGYRHVDTAALYRNERGVGEGLRRSGVAREDVWITTKLWNDDIRSGEARAGLEKCLGKLGLEYVDLFLLHWPVTGGLAAWKELEKLRNEGLARSIGVSNYQVGHLEELMEHAAVAPAVNQIEWHPYLQQDALVARCRALGIAVEGWSPLMQGRFGEEPTFAEIGKAHRKTGAQVLIRWALQRDVITIPKSVTPSRIEENCTVFDFALSEDEMKTIDALDRDYRFGPDPNNFDF